MSWLSGAAAAENTLTDRRLCAREMLGLLLGGGGAGAGVGGGGGLVGLRLATLGDFGGDSSCCERLAPTRDDGTFE